MKKTVVVSAFLFALFFVALNSCSQSSPTSVPVTDNHQQEEIDSLKKMIADMKPGLGEIMLGIQTHHAKLWFAGKNSNWALASFEMDEIHELLEMAQKIETDRPEIVDLPMLFPALDSLTNDIRNKNEKPFEANFSYLTQTCNNCHTKENFEFNVITVPTTFPVSNQDFKAQ